jgi:uncharacterized membrane protein YphA (DoxX/SURF4 family)
MATMFPDLLAFSFIATTLVRIVVGYIFLRIGIENARIVWNEKKSFATTLFSFYSFLYLLVGSALIFGLYTQLFSAFGAILSLFAYAYSSKKKGLGERTFYVLLFTTSFSLIFFGAGAFAFDKPF